MTEKDLYANSFQVHNYYVDVFLHLLTGEEIKVLLYAIRRIHGFHKASDRISLSQFVDGTKSKEGILLDRGTGLSKPTVIKALNSLKSFGLLIELETGSYKNNTATSYALQYQLDKVNTIALEKRANTARENQQAKAVKLKESKTKKVVNGIDQGVVNNINQGSKSHLPKVVNGIDQGVVKAVDQTKLRRETKIENQKKEKEINKEKDFSEQPPAVASSPSDFLNPVSEQKVAKPKQEKTKAPLTFFPRPFNVTQEMREWAKEKSPLVNWQEETEKFKDWALSNAIKKADWEATWRSWLRRTQEGLQAKTPITVKPKIINQNNKPQERRLSSLEKMDLIDKQRLAGEQNG